jgi:hypothetical protein
MMRFSLPPVDTSYPRAHKSWPVEFLRRPRHVRALRKGPSAQCKQAHGSSPEEISFQHPHLSLAQIHAALSYYYDHQQEIDAYIER